MNTTSQAAVLTGDLIGSTRADPGSADRAFVLLTRATGEVSEWIDAETRLTRFRGDGWQIVLPSEPELALRAALFLFACLRAQKSGLTTRIAIGQGRMDFAGTQDLSDARGEAFTRSGRALDSMNKIKSLDASGDLFTPLHSMILNLVAAIIRKWTPEQAEAISYYLHPDQKNTLETIATKLGISLQAVSYRIRGAEGALIRQTLKDWESNLDFLSGDLR